MKFSNIKAMWPEKKGFRLNRTDTGEEYIFICYHTPVEAQGREWPAGTVVMHNKHTAQHFTSLTCDLIHDWFHADGNIPLYMKESGLAFDTYYVVPDWGYITDLVSQIEREWLSKADRHEELTDLMVQMLLLRIGRDVRRDNKSNMGNKMFDALNEARRRIHQDYARAWSVEEMAALVPISPSRFYALYKEAFRVSPKADLQDVRILHAKNLLDAGRYTVREIAEVVGYAGSNPFIRVFKSVTGMTPTQYMEENR